MPHAWMLRRATTHLTLTRANGAAEAVRSAVERLPERLERVVLRAASAYWRFARSPSTEYALSTYRSVQHRVLTSRVVVDVASDRMKRLELAVQRIELIVVLVLQ